MATSRSAPQPRPATSPSYLSPLFAGGMGGRVHAVVALASPMNGSTAYDLAEDPGFDAKSVRVPWWSKVMAAIMDRALRVTPDGRDQRDYAAHDMHVDRALELNERMRPLEHLYYLSVPCMTTVAQADGTHVPKRDTEPLFTRQSYQMGAYTGRTRGGVEIGSSWLENDGLVNTCSEKAPLGAPSKPFDPEAIEPGVWNVMPTLEGDHMWLQGGLMRQHDIRGFYESLLKVIDTLA